MTITSDGLRCDICERPILPILNDSFATFTISCFPNHVFHCHEKKGNAEQKDCDEKVKKSFDARDYKLLPDCTIRRVLDEFNNDPKHKGKIQF